VNALESISSPTTPQRALATSQNWVAGFWAENLILFAAERGLDPRQLRRLLTSEHRSDGETPRVTEDSYFQLWEAIAQRTHSPALPIEYARTMDLAKYGVLGHVCRTAPTVRESLAKLVTHIGHWVENVELRVISPQPKLVEFHFHRVGSRGNVGLRMSNEAALAQILQAMRLSTGRKITPVRIDFRHIPSEALGAYEEFFGCPIQWKSVSDTIWLHADDLEATNIGADASLSDFFDDYVRERFADESSLEEKVMSAISARVVDGMPSLQQVSEALGYNERTLQRRLSRINLSYGQLLDRVRHQLASDLLRSRRSIGDIAQTLGFSSATGFGRAFRRWTGQTPSAYRESVREQARARLRG
jgi:AraC-like DNA-binding protein